MWKPLLTLSVCISATHTHAQFVNSSLEQYNWQIGDNLTEVRSFDGFDEFEEVDSLPGFAQYDFRVNGGQWETINYSNQYESYKRAINYNSLGEMLAARPENGVYEHRITKADTSTSTITLSGPYPAYANAIPITPMFTFGGISDGSWSRNGGEENTGVYTFNPDLFLDGESFTVSLNVYAGYSGAAGQAAVLAVADVRTEYDPIDEFNAIYVPAWEITDDLSAPYSLTFTKGAGPIDAGDDDPLTFMFGDDSRFEIEGEHVNLYSLEDASAELGLAPDSVAKGFIYQTATSLIIAADTSHNPGTPTPGDMNGDGLVTNGDIAPFVQALTDRAGYDATFPGINADLVGDFNNDILLTNGDIASFVDALTGGGAVPEPTSLLLLGMAGFVVGRPRKG